MNTKSSNGGLLPDSDANFSIHRAAQRGGSIIRYEATTNPSKLVRAQFRNRKYAQRPESPCKFMVVAIG